MRVALGMLAVLAAANAQIAILDPVVSDFPGGVRVPDSYTFSAGDKVYIHFRIEGSADLRIEAVDARGKLFEPAMEIPAASGAVERFFVLPGGLWPGSGVFRITASRSGERGAAEVPFGIATELANPPEALTIERFRLFRYDYDKDPADPPAFGLGDTVWARFLLAGFGATPSGESDVEYGLALTNKAGRLLISAPKAVTGRGKSFYPRAYLPGVVSFRLEYTIARGDYLLVITAVDRIGKQKATARHEFRVE